MTEFEVLCSKIDEEYMKWKKELELEILRSMGSSPKQLEEWKKDGIDRKRDKSTRWCIKTDCP